MKALFIREPAFDLLHTGPPVIDQGAEQLDMIVGDTMSITCRVVSGTGNLTVSWIIDGKPVPNGVLSPTVEV